MSTMDNLHGKGWLSRTRDGKAYRYRPTLTREEHSARLMLEAQRGGRKLRGRTESFRRADRRRRVRRSARRVTTPVTKVQTMTVAGASCST